MKCSHRYARTSELCPTCDNRGRVLPLEIELTQLRADLTLRINQAADAALKMRQAQAEVRELRAEVAELRKDAERYRWQPIETAPQQGRHLALISNNVRVIIVWLDSNHPDANESGWYEHWTLDQVIPTHWMPLPAAIAKEKEHG